jgi:anti-sigma28 factor (negative regulator of flagellin synthesis)
LIPLLNDGSNHHATQGVSGNDVKLLGCADICTGENIVICSNGKEDLGSKKPKKTIRHFPSVSGSQDRKTGLTHYSSPIRKEKVKEAKKKKQNGDYNSEEVYKKIADRLMDLFGIR